MRFNNLFSKPKKQKVNYVRSVKPPDELLQAINERKTIKFYYDGHMRNVEPHACGNFSNGNTILVGYQYSGGSNSGSIPDWRSFTVSEIRDLVVMGLTFDNDRPGYNPHDQRFIKVYAKVT